MAGKLSDAVISVLIAEPSQPINMHVAAANMIVGVYLEHYPAKPVF